ncbi:MAG: hypothetical protein HY322_10285 [Betaproteobacteria bacterium]|nr:hypothetical protein [Betaproteobacteria bacterium]
MLRVPRAKSYWKWCGVACLIVQLVPDGWAQGYPARAIRMLVGTSAGGGGDVIGRIIAQGLTQHWGQ